MAALLGPCPHCGAQHEAERLRCPEVGELLPLRGRLLDGKFRMLRELGSGGMATVWLACNEHVEREVALKLLNPDVVNYDEVNERFRKEARAAGRIGSPHICEVLDFAEGPIGPYIVMEYLRGEDFGKVLEVYRRLDAGIVVRIVRMALAGLAAAHAAGVIHRDLKPGNIFLQRTDDDQVTVKLMDFGVSKFQATEGEKRATGTGFLLGTPEYMAPEQLAGSRNIDRTADVFSTGAVLYRALSGERLFSGAEIGEVIRKAANHDFVPLEQIMPDLPRGLVEVVNRCIERERSARFPSAETLSDALAPFEADEATWSAWVLQTRPLHEDTNKVTREIDILEPGGDLADIGVPAGAAQAGAASPAPDAELDATTSVRRVPASPPKLKTAAKLPPPRPLPASASPRPPVAPAVSDDATPSPGPDATTGAADPPAEPDSLDTTTVPIEAPREPASLPARPAGVETPPARPVAPDGQVEAPSRLAVAWPRLAVSVVLLTIGIVALVWVSRAKRDDSARLAEADLAGVLAADSATHRRDSVLPPPRMPTPPTPRDVPKGLGHEDLDATPAPGADLAASMTGAGATVNEEDLLELEDDPPGSTGQAAPAGSTGRVGEPGATGEDVVVADGPRWEVTLPTRNNVSYRRAHDICNRLGKTSHAGRDDWRVPTLSDIEAAKEAGKTIKDAWYWTQNRAGSRRKIVRAKSGRTRSMSQSRRRARPLCIAGP
ncbi:MAG: hypothetical protein B7733_17325 [Myxococcales bacterium FL481]|nr:MAG: hypothetical protein B7733_17325 [Myxococcales bacterium FL481]